MKIHSPTPRALSKPVAALVLLLMTPLVLWAQGGTTAMKPPTADQFAGNYKGTAKDPAGAIVLTVEIKSENGKISGRLIAPQREQPFNSGEVAGGKLTVKTGSGNSATTLVLEPRDKKLVGEWKADGKTRPVELERVPAEKEAVEVKKAPEPSAAELLTGVWDAAADAQGQAFPFTLTLKVDGEKVTGSSSSELGDSTISTGTFKDGKLAVILDSANGQIALVATLTDGKLVGDYDYAGQMQGKWVAAKKKP
jgi:uncharacterized protein with FMN-binding domain